MPALLHYHPHADDLQAISLTEDLTFDEAEFACAAEYQQEATGHICLSWKEVLSVLIGLGYHKDMPTAAERVLSFRPQQTGGAA